MTNLNLENSNKILHWSDMKANVDNKTTTALHAGANAWLWGARKRIKSQSPKRDIIKKKHVFNGLPR